MIDKNLLIKLLDLENGICAARVLAENRDNASYLPEYRFEEARTWVFNHLMDDFQKIKDTIAAEYLQKKRQ